MSRDGNRLCAGCRRFQPGLPDPGGGFFAAGGASRSRWANFFSRCAFSRENDASPRARRGGGKYFDAAGALSFREYYDLRHDPYELTNLLDDGTVSNDPDVAALHRRLAADRACSGTSCP